MAEIITKDRKEYNIWDKVNKVWNKLNFLTNAKSVDADDGKDLQTKVGALNGITSDLNCEDESIAISAKAVNDSLNGISFGYTDDGKPGYREAGADAVTPFKRGKGFAIYPYQTLYSHGGTYGYGSAKSCDDDDITIDGQYIVFSRAGTIRIDYSFHNVHKTYFHAGYEKNGSITYLFSNIANEIVGGSTNITVEEGDKIRLFVITYMGSSDMSFNFMATIFYIPDSN